MAEQRPRPPEDLPEADAVEQRTPLDDTDDSEETDDLSGDLSPAGGGPLGLGQADEADLLEQARAVAGDEDHPYGPLGQEEA